MKVVVLLSLAASVLDKGLPMPCLTGVGIQQTLLPSLDTYHIY